MTRLNAKTPPKWLAAFSGVLLIASLSHAANKYVAPKASGNGSSWSSPGSTEIISNCGPGDIVYLAGGNYGNGFAVHASGSATQPLTIRKATAADHGDAAGWTDAMAAQAVFDTGIGVSGQYVTLDGNEWKPPGLPTKFGILIHHASGAKGVDAGGSPGHLTCIDLDVAGPGINSSKAEADGIHFPPNSRIAGSSVRDTDALLFSWKGNTGSTIEYCLLYNASSNIVLSGNSQDPHPDVLYSGGMLTNGTMRWCLVANVTAEGVFFDKELPGDNMVFYGNIMFQGDCQTGNVPIQLQVGASFGRVFLYHNVFVDFNKSNNLSGGASTADGGACVNNLFINHLPSWDKGVNNNGFSSTGIGTNQIINPANPFSEAGAFKWVKGSGVPPATQVTTGAPKGYNPSGMEVAFVLADNSWAKGKGIAVPAGMNVDLYGHSGNDLGAIQGGGGGSEGGGNPTPVPTPPPQATPTPAPSVPPAAKFKAGDTITPTAPVNVRMAPAGPVVGEHVVGDTGTIVSGPVPAPLNGNSVDWYLIEWATAPATGHSGGDDLVKATLPAPTPTPAPTPPPPTGGGPTYNQWAHEFNAAQAAWVRAHPPVPDQ